MTSAKLLFTYSVIIPYSESASPRKRFTIEYSVEAPDRETALQKAEREFFAYTQYNSAAWVRVIEREGIRVWRMIPNMPQTPQSIDELAGLLRSPDEDVIYNTLTSLGALEDAGPSSLITPLLGHPNDDIKALAAETLGKVGDPANLPVLLRHYRPEAPPRLKACILSSLSRLARSGDPISDVIASAIGDPDPRVRANAVEAVERLKLPATTRMLAPLLEDEDNRVRANVLKALWDTHDRARLAIVLREMAANPNHWMRASAAFVLRHVRIEGQLKVVEALLNDRIPEVHANAWKAILELSDIECIPIWFEHLNPLHVADFPRIQGKLETIGKPALDALLSIKPRSEEELRCLQTILKTFEKQAWDREGWLGWIKLKQRRFFSNP